MRRRSLLIGIVSTALGGAVAATSHWTLFGRFSETGFAQYLRLRCHYLNLEVTPAEFEKFVHLYKKHYGLHAPRWSPGALEPMVQVFLMSTDFFSNGADESKPVRYRRFFHPYLSPCWNPLIQREPVSKTGS
jgi:hypothetical protein